MEIGTAQHLYLTSILRASSGGAPGDRRPRGGRRWLGVYRTSTGR